MGDVGRNPGAEAASSAQEEAVSGGPRNLQHISNWGMSRK